MLEYYDYFRISEMFIMKSMKYLYRWILINRIICIGIEIIYENVQLRGEILLDVFIQ